MEVRKKVNAFLVIIMMGFFCIVAPTNTVQAVEEAEDITEHLCDVGTEDSTMPLSMNATQCPRCNQAAAWACLRYKAQLYDTSTHGNGCKKMYYRAPSAWHCTWCGWYDEEPFMGLYHYCYIIHTSCGKGSESMCQCETVYTPIYGR